MYSDPVIGRTLPHVNGMDVYVVITLWEIIEGFGRYQVQSWVGSDNWVNASTKIDAIITTTWLDYGGITNNVITSPNGYTTQGPTTIEPGEGEEHGPVGDYRGPWPTPEELIAWYARDVDKDNPYPYDEVDLDGNDLSIGPEYVDSNFSIINSDNTEATLTLTDTLYITGDTLIGATNKDFTIDLNGQTIFVESGTTSGGTSSAALWIGSRCTLVGSGCIIAVGDINFEPNLETLPGEYILVLSLIGQTWMHPNGDFYGTLAGYSEVFIQNGDVTWTEPTDGLNFPGSGGDMVWGIHTWSYWTIGDETP